jgi:glutathione S-transferase
MSKIELYSAALCPFAHRSRLTLQEKGVPYELIEIDLRNKPANFTTISPYGKVPVLKDGFHRVWESAIINEYLNDRFPHPPLLPQDPMGRAQARIWINFADTRLYATTAKLLYSSTAQPQTDLLAELSDHLQFLEQEGLPNLSMEGPYWLGTEASLVDFAYYPWFEQVAVLEKFRGFQWPKELTRLKAWWQTMTNRASVRELAKPPAFYTEAYAKLAKQYGF